jgi:hypothetical protein
MKSTKEKLIVKSNVDQYIKNAQNSNDDLNQKKKGVSFKPSSLRMYDSFYDKKA